MTKTSTHDMPILESSMLHKLNILSIALKDIVNKIEVPRDIRTVSTLEYEIGGMSRGVRFFCCMQVTRRKCSMETPRNFVKKSNSVRSSSVRSKIEVPRDVRNSKGP